MSNSFVVNCWCPVAITRCRKTWMWGHGGLMDFKAWLVGLAWFGGFSFGWWKRGLSWVDLLVWIKFWPWVVALVGFTEMWISGKFYCLPMIVGYGDWCWSLKVVCIQFEGGCLYVTVVLMGSWEVVVGGKK